MRGRHTGRPSRRRRILLAAAVLPALSLAIACGGPPAPLAEQVEVTGITTGWYDAGIVEGGKNKLVPTIALQLRSSSAEPVRVVQLNAVFRTVDDPDREWGTAYARAVGSEGLMPGDSTPPIVLRSELGYTGEQPRHEMLQHSQFNDATVELFGKHGSAQWEKLGEFPVERQLLTQ